MSGVLVYCERDDLAGDLLAWSGDHRQTLGPVSAAALGAAARSRAEALRRFGPERLYVAEDPALASLADEVLSAALEQIAAQAEASLILIGATRRGRSLAPRLAQRLGAGCVNEAVELAMQEGQLVAGRYSLGGNTISREVVRTPRAVVSVLPGTVPRAGPGDAAGEAIAMALQLPATRTVVVEQREKRAAAVDIATSERLVCVGRGLARQEDLPLVEELARALQGEVACSRALSYEYGWLPEDRMIGISGKKCSPRLLLSLGVSGQVQHTVGISGARTIVAVNTDPNAPIFKLADYGIVGDLYAVAPRLTQLLRQRR